MSSNVIVSSDKEPIVPEIVPVINIAKHMELMELITLALEDADDKDSAGEESSGAAMSGTKK
jgi:hypothetical protein